MDSLSADPWRKDSKSLKKKYAEGKKPGKGMVSHIILCNTGREKNVG